MMDHEFRKRPRSIYGKNRPTPATQFAMILLLHVISTPFTRDRFILFIPVQSKGDGFSFFLVTLTLASPPLAFLDRPGRKSHRQQGEHASTLQSTLRASIGSTDHNQIESFFKTMSFFYTILRDANPGQPVRLNIR